MQGGTISTVIDDLAMARPPRLTFDMYRLAMGFSRHPIPTSPIPAHGRPPGIHYLVQLALALCISLSRAAAQGLSAKIDNPNRICGAVQKVQ